MFERVVDSEHDGDTLATRPRDAKSAARQPRPYGRPVSTVLPRIPTQRTTNTERCPLSTIDVTR